MAAYKQRVSEKITSIMNMNAYDIVYQHDIGIDLSEIKGSKTEVENLKRNLKEGTKLKIAEGYIKNGRNISRKVYRSISVVKKYRNVVQCAYTAHGHTFYITPSYVQLLFMLRGNEIGVIDG